ncbi:MAG: hypothetical protein ACI9QD_000642 [Thermoproteota archaeon]|jgi:hypothetical protein
MSDVGGTDFALLIIKSKHKGESMFKTFLHLLVSLATLIGIAQADIGVLELNQKKIRVSTDSTIIVRNHKTPKKVKIKMQVPMKARRCVESATRRVTRRDPVCGHHTERRVRNCRNVCVKRRTCPTGATNCVNKCIKTQRRCDVSHVRVTNICSFQEPYCVRTSVVRVGSQTEQVTIKFKNLPTLREGEEERFMLRASQRSIGGSGVRFTIKGERTLEDYKIKTREFLGDVITIKN